MFFSNKDRTHPETPGHQSPGKRGETPNKLERIEIKQYVL